MKIPHDSRHRQLPAKDTRLANKPSRKQRVSINKQPPPTPVKKSQLRGYLSILGAIALLITSSGVIVGGIWFGILLMVNPNAVVWINQFLPQWTRIPVTATSAPKTLTAIQDEIRKSELIPGEPLALSKSGISNSSTAILLPILKSSLICQTDCEQIVELRVYQPTKSAENQNYYQLVTQIEIAGPEEYFVLSSLLGTDSERANTSRSLPLTQLSRLDENAPEPGFWFNLSGQQLGGDTPTTYGQVIHYNPDQMHLSVMLQWTAPNEQSPYWQQITGDSKSELVINQTVGLEPRFKVYQLQPRNFVPNPVTLEEISLSTPALETQRYRDALLLARHGLWSPALQALQPQKSQTSKKWTAIAQAQMDVIQLHAQVTKSQAMQAWASPSSSILANLIDGRWADALLVFRSSVPSTQAQEIVTLLQTDSGGLWDRVETALKVNPDDDDVKAWGTLIVAAKQGRAKAIAWLVSRSKNEPLSNPQIDELLDRLDAVSGKTFPANHHISRIVGTAQPVLNVNPAEWLQPEDPAAGEQLPFNAANNQLFPESPPPSPSLAATPSPLQLEPLQIWYQVQVAAFNDGQQWWQAPFSNLPLPQTVSAKQLWNYLGLDTDSQIQITLSTADGRQEATLATVKGVSVQGGTIQLLAAGDVLPSMKSIASAAQTSRLLAYTGGAVEWIEPASLTLSDLNNVQPQWVSVFLPELWRELKTGGWLTTNELPSNAVPSGEMAQWSVRLVELTGNNRPDAVVTLYEDHSGLVKKLESEPPIGDSQLYKPRTLIFSDTGALLYSEFSQDAGTSLTAIADLGDGGPPALVLKGKSNYSFKRWSSQNKRFD